MAKQIRIWTISLLAVAGVVCLACEPTKEETWLMTFLLSKTAGFMLWGIAAVLYKYWDKRGMLPEDNYENEYR